MTRFRIYTETRKNLKDLTYHFFHEATFIDAKGLWKKKLEDTTIIEVIELDDFWYHNSSAKIANLAERIKIENNQEAVLVTVDKTRAELV